MGCLVGLVRSLLRCVWLLVMGMTMVIKGRMMCDGWVVNYNKQGIVCYC